MTDQQQDRGVTRQCPIPGCIERHRDKDSLSGHLMHDHEMGLEAAKRKSAAKFQ